MKLKSLFILLLALSLIFTGCKTESSSEEDSYIGSELENEYPSIDNLIKEWLFNNYTTTFENLKHDEGLCGWFSSSQKYISIIFEFYFVYDDYSDTHYGYMPSENDAEDLVKHITELIKKSYGHYKKIKTIGMNNLGGDNIVIGIQLK